MFLIMNQWFLNNESAFLLQQEVLQESKQMVPDTVKRLRNAYDELKGIVVSVGPVSYTHLTLPTS